RLEVLKQVDLVVDLENRQLKGADLAQHQMHLLDIGSPLGIGGVDHMQQQIGLTGFLQRGTESLYQLVRQMADETYGIGQHDRAYIGQLDAAQGRIQGREQLIGGVHRRLGQPVEQGGFAGVGIADQGDHGDFRPSPCTPGLITLAADLLQTLGDLLDAHPQQTAAGFQLGFPRTTQADTTLLPSKVGPAADQTGTQMIELGQLDLQLALVGTGALGEDIQNQTGTVDHPALQFALQVTLLAGGQHVVEDDQVALPRLDQSTQLIHLAAADQETRAGLIAGDGHEVDHLGARRPYQFEKLVRVLTALLVLALEMNEYCPLPPFMALKEQSGHLHAQGLASASSPP